MLTHAPTSARTSRATVALISAGLDGIAMPDVVQAGVVACLEKGTLTSRQLTDRLTALAELSARR